MSDRGRVVVVTGGAQGIGRAIAEAFAQNGDFVAITDLNLEGAEKAADEIGNCKGYQVDVSREESVVSLINKILDDKGTIDVLVNNAGIQHIDRVENFPLEKWNQVIGVALTGTFLMTKHVLPVMQKKSYGRIINISAVHGQIADPFKSAYIAAKFGVEGFTRTVALENAKAGITANNIMPGPVDTSLVRNQIKKLAETDNTSEQEAMEKHMLGKQPMKRLLKPSEIAGAAIYLASDGAAPITGISLNVSGGMLA